MNSRGASVVALTVLLAYCAGALPLSQGLGADLPSVFDLPALEKQYLRLQKEISGSFRQDRHEEAERLGREAVGLLPNVPEGHYNLACAEARLGKRDQAIGSLGRAIEAGFRNAAWMEKDPDLDSLHDDARFVELLETIRRNAEADRPRPQRVVRPVAIEDRVAWVREENTAWNSKLGAFLVFFTFPSSDVPNPAPAAGQTNSPDTDNTPATVDPSPVVEGHGEVGKLLNQWFLEGTCAGNHGDLYDNHDRDHSNLAYNQFPQLTRIEFDEEAQKREIHTGLQCRFFYNSVTFGNSSMADTSGLFWRSLPRLAYTNPRGVATLYRQYTENHLYVYPEHRDHDPGHNGEGGYGDVYCANTPYVTISQGSSGTDRPFLDALACTLAAFRPQVKATLVRERVLVPTVQMILRMSNRQVDEPQEYLSGKAHPTVFRGEQLDVLKMVHMAHDMRNNEVPPFVRLRVVEEDQAVAGRDYFEPVPHERLFDSPAAIARVGHSTKFARRMVISAEDTFDLNRRPLTWHWVVLRGDEEVIEINALNEAGSVAELIVPYHARRPIEPGSTMESNRVDMGVFAHNGKYYSAPSFVTVFYLDNEIRIYNKKQLIQSVSYADPTHGSNYVDPAISLPKHWHDEYQYDEHDQLIGWTRHRDGQLEEFTAEGALVIERDQRKRATKARTVLYAAAATDAKIPVVEQRVGDEILHYEYTSDEDRVGRIKLRTKAQAQQTGPDS